MNYEEMSDFEVNKLIVGVVNGCLGWTFNSKDRCYVRYIKSGKTSIVETYYINDYCNNPSDAWPIILQTCMTIELPDPNLGGIGTNTIYNPMGADWYCDYEDKGECFRAAMICFLKMKDAER